MQRLFHCPLRTEKLHAIRCTQKQRLLPCPLRTEKLHAIRCTAFCLGHCVQKNCTPLDALKNSTFCPAHCAQNNCILRAEKIAHRLMHSKTAPIACQKGTEKLHVVVCAQETFPFGFLCAHSKTIRLSVRSKNSPFALPRDTHLQKKTAPPPSSASA